MTGIYEAIHEIIKALNEVKKKKIGIIIIHYYYYFFFFYRRINN